MSNYCAQMHPRPCDPLCLTGPRAELDLPLTVYQGPAPCRQGPAAALRGVGTGQGGIKGPDMVTEVQKGDPGAVGVQSKCGPELGSKEYPENKDRRKASGQDQSRGSWNSAWGPPAPVRVWYSLSPHPGQGCCDPWGPWGVRAQPPPLPFLDRLLQAEEGHTPCTWAAEGVQCPPWEQRRSGAPPHLADGGVSPARCPGSRTAVCLCLTWGP